MEVQVEPLDLSNRRQAAHSPQEELASRGWNQTDSRNSAGIASVYAEKVEQCTGTNNVDANRKASMIGETITVGSFVNVRVSSREILTNQVFIPCSSTFTMTTTTSTVSSTSRVLRPPTMVNLMTPVYIQPTIDAMGVPSNVSALGSHTRCSEGSLSNSRVISKDSIQVLEIIPQSVATVPNELSSFVGSFGRRSHCGDVGVEKLIENNDRKCCDEVLSQSNNAKLDEPTAIANQEFRIQYSPPVNFADDRDIQILGTNISSWRTVGSLARGRKSEDFDLETSSCGRNFQEMDNMVTDDVTSSRNVEIREDLEDSLSSQFPESCRKLHISDGKKEKEAVSASALLIQPEKVRFCTSNLDVKQRVGSVMAVRGSDVPQLSSLSWRKFASGKHLLNDGLSRRRAIHDLRQFSEKRRIGPCFECQAMDHRFYDCPKRVCYRCKKPGHTYHHCTEELNNVSWSTSMVECQFCGMKDVEFSNCPDCKPIQAWFGSWKEKGKLRDMSKIIW